MQNTKEPHRIHNPTSPCSCHVRHFHKVLDGKTYNHEEIVYCPVHSAAPELMEALGSLLSDHMAMSKERKALRGSAWVELPIQTHCKSVLAKATGGQQ